MTEDTGIIIPIKVLSQMKEYLDNAINIKVLYHPDSLTMAKNAIADMKFNTMRCQELLIENTKGNKL